MKTKIGFFRPIRKLTKSVTGLFLKSPGWRSDDMSRKNAILFLLVIIAVIFFNLFVLQNSVLAQHRNGASDAMPGISSQDIESGWYYGSLDQKKPGTPDDLIHVLEGSRSACWHKPGIRCGGENSEEKELEKKVQATVTELQELLRQKQSEGADVSKALELDRQSKEAFDQGRPEECLRLLTEAVALLRGNQKQSEEIDKPKATSGRQSVKTTKSHGQPNKDLPFGFNEGYWPPPVMPLSSIEMYSKVMAGIRVKWARIHVIWDIVEPQKGRFDWTGYDAIVKSAEKDGINLLAVIAPIAQWDQQNYYAPGAYTPRTEAEIGRKKPYDMKAYRAFVKKLVDRYNNDGIEDMPGLRHGIKYWEVMNEVEEPRFFDGTVMDYAEILKTTFSAIKESDKGAHVLLAGIMDQIEKKANENYHSWFDNILAIGMEDYFDITNYHMYQMYFKRNSSYYKSHSSKPLWITETGIPSEGNLPYKLSEAIQAQEVIKRSVLGIASGAEKVFWHKLVDAKYSDSPSMGVVKEDFTPKLSYFTYKKLIEVLEGSDWKNIKTIKEVQNDAYGLFLYKFTRNGKPVYVGWFDCFDEQKCSVMRIDLRADLAFDRVVKTVKITEAVPRYESGKEVKDYKIAFNTETKPVQDGKITIILKEIPVFVEEQ